MNDGNERLKLIELLKLIKQPAECQRFIQNNRGILLEALRRMD